MVERLAVNQNVTGSSPVAGANLHSPTPRTLGGILRYTSRDDLGAVNGLATGAVFLALSAFLLASLAQLVEQLICNQQVAGSSPTAGST